MFNGFTRHHYQIGFNTIEHLLADIKQPNPGLQEGNEYIIAIRHPTGDARYLDIYTLRKEQDTSQPDDPQGTEPDFFEELQAMRTRAETAESRIAAITKWVAQLPTEARIDMPELQAP